MAQDNKSEDIKWLYGRLKSQGYDIGTEDEFKNSLNNMEDREWYYEKARGMGLEVGDRDEFDRLFAPPAASGTQAQRQGQAATLPAGTVPALGMDAVSQTGYEPESPWKLSPSPAIPAWGGQDAGAPDGGKEAAEPAEPARMLTPDEMSDFLQGERERIAAGTEDVIERSKRIADRNTPQGRQAERNAEWAAHVAGTPTRVLGVPKAAVKDESPTGDAPVQEQEQVKASGQSPVPHGVVYEDGEPRTEWVLPDGSLTTSRMDAEYAEYAARQARDEQRLADRMRAMGLDPDKPEDVQTEYLLKEKRRIETEMGKRGKELDVESAGFSWRDMPRGGGALVHTYNSATANGRLADPAYKALTAQLHQVNEGLAVLDASKRNKAADRWIDDSSNWAARKAKQLAAFGIGSWRGLAHAVGKVSTWDMGMTDMANNAMLYQAATDADRQGIDNISQEERDLLNLAANTNAIQAKYGKDLGYGYAAGNITGESLPFMMEFILNPASRLGPTAVNRMMRVAVKRYGKAAVKAAAKKYLAAKIGTRVVGDIAGAAVMAGTTGQGRVTADMLNRMTGDVQFREDGNGRIVYDGREGAEDSMATALLKAFGAQTIENHSEMLGVYFAPILGKAAKLGRKGMEKIGLGKVNRLIDDLGATNAARMLDDFKTRTRWDGTVEEYAEEVAGGIENALLVGDNTLDAAEGRGVFNLEENIKTFLGVGLMGGFLAGAKMVSYRGPKRRALNEMAEAGKAIDSVLEGNYPLMEQWGKWRNTFLTGTDEEKESALREVMNNEELPWAFRKGVLGFVKAAQKYEGLSRAQENKVENGEQEPAARMYDASYDTGYETTDPEGMEAVRSRMEAERKRLAEILGLDNPSEVDGHIGDPLGFVEEQRKLGDEEQVQAAADYANARSAYEGMVQRVRDDMDSRIEESNREIEARTHVGDRTLQRATLKMKDEDGNDRHVYVTNGRLVMLEDGSGIDHELSDKQVTVRDAVTGEQQAMSPDFILRVDEPVDAEEEKERAAQEIRASLPFPVEDAREKPVRPQTRSYELNEELELPDGKGGAVKGTVLAVGSVSDGHKGSYLVETGTGVNGKRAVDWYSQEELDGMLAVQDADASAQDMDVAAQDANVAAQDAGVPLAPPGTEELVRMAREGDELARHQLEAQGVAWKESSPALPRVPVNEQTGEPMFEKADRETALDALNEVTGGNEKNTATIVNAQVEQAQKVVEALKKRKPTKKAPVLKGSPMEMLKAQQEAEAAYKTAVEQYDSQVAQAEETLKAWRGIHALMNERRQAVLDRQEAERKERERLLHEEAVARAEEEKRLAAARAAEQAEVGTHAVNPKIKEKWDSAAKVDGNANAITLADGSTLRGHYVLTEAGAATASHDVDNGFEPSEGFPVDEYGESVNDRDYRRDADAQRIVREIAGNYDSRALQSPVIVSRDGIVLSGNNRTMSGELAAQQGTDKAYVEHLREFGQMYGFTPEQIDGMEHPRVVFVPDEELPYDAATFARFNAEQQKRQSKPEQAVKLGKTVPEDVFRRIVGEVSRYDRLPDFYADDRAVASVLGELVQAGVVNEMQLPELRTGGSLSAVGREFVENVLIGKAFEGSPDAVRQVTGSPTLRQSVVTGLNEIAHNRTLTQSGYDLSGELAAAIDLVHRAKAAAPQVYKPGVPVSSFARQQGLFDDEHGDSRVTDATVLLLADVLNSGRPGDLRKVLATYNNEAASPAGGQMDMFSGGVASKEELLNQVNEYFKNATPREQQAAVDAAVAERKQRAEASAQVADGTESDEGNTADIQGESDSRVPETHAGLNDGEADELLSRMEANTSDIPQIELTPSNWIEQFGENGMVSTPMGEVKMGENQIAKLFEKGRSEQFGMIKPTLEHPHVVIEVPSEAVDGNTERASSLLFIKTFNGKDGKKVYYFKSVTVKKDGLEVSVSSHYDRAKRVKEALKKGKLLYRFDGGAQTERHPADVSVTTSPNMTQGKDIWPEPTVGSNANTDTAEVADSPAEAAKGETVDRGGNSSQPISSVDKVINNQTDLQGNPEKSIANEGDSDQRQGDLAETGVTAPLSDEVNEFDKPFIISSNGSTTFGEIGDESGLTAAPIKLSLGENVRDDKGVNHGYGWLHIEAGHGDQIRAAGFASVEEFVETVARNYKTIRKGSIIANNQTYLLELSDEHNNTLFIQLSRDGSYWNVNSAGIFKKKYSRHKPEVFTRPAVEPSTNTDTSGVNSDQTEGVTTPAGNSPQTSVSKDGNKESELQENPEKSSANEGETSLSEQIAAASAEVNTDPTEAQKEAGNYKKGHVQVGTFDITIEQPQGSVRKGTDADGKQWESKMNNTYGYFRGTEGVDGDHIDVFLTNDIDGWNGRKVYVVDQYNPDGTFDEHKVMLGFNDMDEAKSDYLANYEKGWEDGRRIDVSTTSLEDFEKWIQSSHRKTKPFAEYAGVKKDKIEPENIFQKADRIAREAREKREKDKVEARTDNQGNPTNADGTLKLEQLSSMDELTDEDFSNPTRNVALPPLPAKVDDVIGAEGKKVVIKKNIFEKNKKRHKDLNPSQGRDILSSALYRPDLYGQNQKATRPYNWILIHNAKKHSSVILEVNHNKDNVEIVNWHYLDDVTLEQKERQAVKEGGLILTLESAAGNTQNDLSSDGKVTTKSTGKQRAKNKKVEPDQPIGDLFAGLVDKPKDNGLERNHDALRTEGLQTDRDRNGRRRSSVRDSKEVPQTSGRADGQGKGGGNGTREEVPQGDGRRVGRVQGLAEPRNTRNNHSERGADHAPVSVNARIEANIRAIELAHELLESGETTSPEQMRVLRQFSGWGGLGTAFSDGGYDWKLRERNQKIRELLGEEAYEQAVMSANSAYYTPAYVVDTLWDIAERLGFKGGNILEGSAGIGNILGQMPATVSERSDIHAIEIDGTSGGILSLLYPDAKVDIQGFEQTRIPNGSVDLAITNVPFVTGLRVNDTTGDSDLSKKFHNIHDFCIAKNVRKLREGGLGIFISSNGTLDGSKALRDWVVNEGGSDFIGAFRMHNKTFGGTTVTSDIIVIRKRVNGQKSAQAIDVSSISGERTAEYEEPGARKAKQLSMDYNKYFIEHPDHMAGEMRFAFEEGDTFRPTSKGLYPVSGKDQGKMLVDFVKSFTEEAGGSVATTESAKPSYVSDASADGRKLGEMYMKDGKIVVAGIGGYVPLDVNDKKIKGHTKEECFKAYSAIKTALADVMKYQTENEDNAGLQPLIDKLNKAYDDFVSTYGHFNKNNQLAWLRGDVDYPNVFSLETYKEQGDGKGGVVKTYGKADVMKGRVVEKESEPHPENVKDGVVVSMFKNGRIDVPYIAEQLGKSEEAVKREIIDSGLGFEDPTTRQIEVSYQYLSGNVREKLRQAEVNNENGEYGKNIKALQEVVPIDIPAHLIDFTLGSSWLDPKLYDEYVKERTDINVHFTSAGGTWFMDSPSYGLNVEKNRAMGIVSEMLKKTVMGHELIAAAIQNKSIIVSSTKKNWDGSSETIVDKGATSACAARIEEIRQDFKDWMRGKMQGDADLSARMEREYNERFNNYVPMRIPDEFVPKYFEGATHKFTMRPHQGKAIVRGTMQPLLLAHEVGTGKTFTLISTAMEMRRLGTARKPMIVVQNATVGQFAKDAKELYPNAKILVLEDSDRNAEGRKNFYAKIKYNDWDMIVVPQSTFEFIPDSDERQMQFVQDKIDEKMFVLEQMRQADSSGRDPITRRAEKELADLQAEMAALSDGISKKRTANNEKKKAVAKQNAAVKAQEMLDRRTDDVENFDDMGIDALLIDEAHEYKHLGFATAMQRGVKGVDPSYSKKSQGVYLKTQAVLEKMGGRNVIFATGTPISNTAAEIWTFMRYLMPKDTMKEYGIYYFDDFVRNFGNLQQMLEFNTSGKFKEVNRFAGYVNLPELVRIWSGAADTVLTKDQTELVEKIPEMEGGKAQDIYLPQTRALRSVMKYVRAELERFDQMSGKEKKENSSIPLTMYGIAQGAAVDARLVEMHAEDDPMSKTNEAVRQTLRSLKETDDYKGTVAIFADHYQNKHSGFNLYEDIKKKLIAQGIPADEVVVMKPGMTIKKKLEIFEKVNRGEVRVILGSTATLGTGVNIQERLHTLIHLDAPNRPMDYTQRNGRILRQGNLHKQWGKPVRVLRFGVEDSLDVTAYQRLKTKGAIADSVMEGDRLMQDSMNNRVLEEEEDVFGDTVAQLSGSEYALLKNNAEKNVRKYESRKKQWEADQTYIHNAKPKLEGQIKTAEQRAEEANTHLLAVQKAFPDGRFTEITVGKQKFGTVDEMADFIKEHNKKILDAVKAMKENPGNAAQTNTLTLSLGGYDFVVKTEMSREMTRKGGSLFAEVRRKMTYSCPELGLTDIPVKQSLLRNAVEDITENVITGKDFAERSDNATRAAAHGKSELEQLRQREGKPFEFGKELEEAKSQLEEYTEAMKVEMAEKEKKYAEMDASVEAAKDIVATDEENEEEVEKFRDGEEDLEYVNEKFNNELQQQIDGLLPDGHIYQMGKPGKVLLSTGVPNLPIQMNAKRLQVKATSFGHDFDLEEVTDLVKALQHPIAVFAYGDKSKAQNIIVPLQKDGKNFIVGLSLNPTVGGRRLEINSIRNVFPKNNSEWINWIGQGKALYLDKEKIQALIDQQRTNLADVDYLDLDSVAKVIESFENPSIRESNPASEHEEMAARVNELSERLHTPVRIVGTDEEVSELPSVRQRRAKGWTNPMTGEVVIVLPNHTDVADVENTVVHEIVGHDGLRVLFPEEEKLNNALDELYRVSKDEIRNTIDRMARKMYDAEVDRLREKKRKEHEAKGEDANAFYYADMAEAHVEASKRREEFRRTATEEYGADLAGRIGEEGFERMSADERTFWGRLKAMLQRALQRLLDGLHIPGKRAWTDKEWAFVLHESYKRKKNGGRPTLFDVAETGVMRWKTGFDSAPSPTDSAREASAIVEDAVREGRYMKAPNGVPSKLDARQWVQVRTSAFKAWAGDWENDPEHATVVLDENGEPLVVYHGTDAEFTTFEPERGDGAHRGMYFTDSKEMAASYKGGKHLMPVFLNLRDVYEFDGRGRNWADLTVEYPYDRKSGEDVLEHAEKVVRMYRAEVESRRRRGGNAEEYAQFISELRVPRLLSAYRAAEGEKPGNLFAAIARLVKLRSLRREMGRFFRSADRELGSSLSTRDIDLTHDDRDGIVFRNIRDYGAQVGNDAPHDVYVVYDPNNIKSATGNNGEFSRENDDIMFRDGNLEDVNTQFNEELMRYQRGEMNKNEMLHIGRPQGVMRAFLPDLPIVMRQRVIRKGSEKKHEVDVLAIMDMPKHLSSPIFIFQRSEDTIGVLTDMRDRNGKNVCVAIELKRQIQQGAEYLKVNDVRSFHGREFKNIVEPIANNNTLRWVDKEKGLAYLSSASQPVQQEIDKKVLSSATKVVDLNSATL